MKHPFSSSPVQFLKRPIAVALASVLCGQAGAEELASLEEIYVTSQKRVQILREVPVSVAAVDGEKIDAMGVENIEDLTAFAPSVHFTETGLSTQLRVRGIGSDNSQGFEQSVGVYKDGIYHSRAQLFRAPMFDVERVEILRGPQSTLFGKNSIAGAIDIISAKPTEEFSAKLTGSYESEFGTQELSGFVSGPLSDNLKGRIAIRYFDDPGYMVNTVKNEDQPNQEEQSIRASLDWQPADNWNVLFTVEHDTFDVIGRTAEATLDEPREGGIPYHQLLLGIQSQLMTFNVLPSDYVPVTFEPNLDHHRQTNTEELSQNTVDMQTLRVDYDAEKFSITSITGHLAFDYEENCDCDFTPVEMFNADLEEDYKQLSQEIRVVSADDSEFTWLAGLFYQKYDQTFIDKLNVPTNSLLVPILRSTRPHIPLQLLGTAVERDFEQSSKVAAAFAEGTWHINDNTHLTLGARFTEEKKDATKVINIIDIATETPIDNPQVAFTYYDIFNTQAEQSIQNFIVDEDDPSASAWEVDEAGNPVISPIGHNLSGSRDESSFTPSINLSIDLTDNIMNYGKISKGYKAGGFDPRSNVKTRSANELEAGETTPAQVSAFEFEEEEVIAYELGSKMRLYEGKMELNIALYRMDYDNLQISQFDGSVGFNVGNAKETVVQGLELDGRIQLAEDFMGTFGFSYMDFEYKDFKNGNCHYGQQGDEISGLCDYSGMTGVYTPEFILNGSLNYSREVAAGVRFISVMDVQWVDDQQVHVNLDPYGETDPYTLLSLRLAIAADNWEVALLGKNLLDEEVVTYSGNTPLSETIAQSRTFYSFVQRPRTVALEATWKF